MNIREKVFAALMASTTLTDSLAKNSKSQCIFHCRNPAAKNYPILVYSIIDDVPAVIADGVELVRRVTFKISILTTDAVFEPMYGEIVKVMLNLGFMRVQTVEESKDKLLVKSVNFRIDVDMED